MASVSISADWTTYQGSAPGWWAIQNPWNNGDLVNGQDYTQTITVSPTTFPNGTVLSWSWPAYANSDNVWGYPEVVYGAQAGVWTSPDGNDPTPVQIDNLTALTGTINLALSGNTNEYDVLWETHLTSAPDSGQVDEFGIMLHAPPYVQAWFDGLTQKYSYNEAGLSATIAVTSNGTNPYILVFPNQGDMLSGTVDIRSILDFLVSQGVLTGHEYIDGFELGAEPQQGSGSVTINTLGYDWNGTIVGSGTPPATTTSGGGTPSTTTPSGSAPPPAPETIVIAAKNAAPQENVSNAIITASSGSHMVFIGGTGDVITLTGGAETVQAYQGDNTITTGNSNDTIRIAGSGNVVNAGAGTNTIDDTGAANTIILPAAQHGDDLIYGNVTTNGDTFDLRALLAATSWNGTPSNIGEFISIATRNNNAVISVTPTGATNGTKHAVATLEGSGAVSLTTLLAHAIT